MRPHRIAVADVADLLGMSTAAVASAVGHMKNDGEMIDRERLTPNLAGRTSRCPQCGRDLPSPRCHCDPAAI